MLRETHLTQAFTNEAHRRSTFANGIDRIKNESLSRWILFQCLRISLVQIIGKSVGLCFLQSGPKNVSLLQTKTLGTSYSETTNL